MYVARVESNQIRSIETDYSEITFCHYTVIVFDFHKVKKQHTQTQNNQLYFDAQRGHSQKTTRQGDSTTLNMNVLLVLWDLETRISLFFRYKIN